MDCQLVKTLIPDWLNGDIEASGRLEIERHVLSCECCRDEAELWKGIHTGLRDGRDDLHAPSGFTAGVMAQLPQKHGFLYQDIFLRWKRSIAAAATFLLLAAGSAGAYLQWGTGTAVHVADGDNSQPGYVARNDPAPEDRPGITVEPNINNPNPSTTPGNNEASNPPKAAGNKDGSGESGPMNDPGQPAAAGQGEGAPLTVEDGKFALLSIKDEMVLERTFLRIKADDFNDVRKRALAHISSAGGEYEVLGAESTGIGNQLSIKVSVNTESAGTLLGELKDLGPVTEDKPQQESITERYREKVEQYNTLAAQANALEDREKIAELQVKMATIKSQLDAWDRETEMHTIILWIED